MKLNLLGLKFNDLRNNNFFEDQVDVDEIINYLGDVSINHNIADITHTDKLFIVGFNKSAKASQLDKIAPLVRSYLDWSFNVKSKTIRDYPANAQLIARYSTLLHMARLLDERAQEFDSYEPEIAEQMEFDSPGKHTALLHDYFFNNLKIEDKYYESDLEVRIFGEFKKRNDSYKLYNNPGIGFENLVLRGNMNEFQRFLSTVRKYYEGMHALSENEKTEKTRNLILAFGHIADYGKTVGRIDYERFLQKGPISRKIPLMYSTVHATQLSEQDIKKYNQHLAKKFIDEISKN